MASEMHSESERSKTQSWSIDNFHWEIFTYNLQWLTRLRYEVRAVGTSILHPWWGVGGLRPWYRVTPCLHPTLYTSTSVTGIPKREEKREKREGKKGVGYTTQDPARREERLVNIPSLVKLASTSTTTGTDTGTMNTSMVRSKFLSNPEDLGVVAVGFSGGQVR
ncbi:hypothetical protein F5X96DRAFT_402932 [Biscogniauxia mediterranea]|nr:hypothetical protein F5X96DRAFT_402932 [Biscogniauxia mediterranea]